MANTMNLIFPHKDFKIYVADTSSIYVNEPYGHEPIPINDDATFTVEYGGSYSTKTANILLINTRKNKSEAISFYNDNNKTIYVGFELPLDTVLYYNANIMGIGNKKIFLADKRGYYFAYVNNHNFLDENLIVDGFFENKKAIKFQAQSSKVVTIDWSNSAFIPNNLITLELRFRFDSFVNDYNIIIKTHVTLGGWGEIWLKLNLEGRYFLEIKHHGSYYSTILPRSFDPEDWHVLAVSSSISGSNLCEVYLDGIRRIRATMSYPLFGNTNLIFGRNLKSDIIYDEIVLYNTNKYTEDTYEVNNSYPLYDPPFVIEPTPVAVVLSSANSVKKGETVTLDASRSYLEGGTITKYSWCNGADTPTMRETIFESGYHFCSVTGSNNTTSTGYVYVEATDEPIIEHDPVAIISADKTYCKLGETVELSGKRSYCEGAEIISYLWSTGETTDTIQVTPTETTIYTLTVTSDNGRSNQNSITITIVSGEIDLMHYLPIYWHPNLEMIQIQKKSLNFLMYNFNENSNIITTEAYISTSHDARLSEWEWDLEIKKADNIETRRENILAFFQGKGKLNEEKIKSIVYFYYGTNCDVSIKDSNIHILIYPLNENDIDYSKIERDLYKKKPAHLGIWCDRYYYTWGEVKADYTDWGDMLSQRETWGKLKNYLPYLNN
jgi:hypothetical protein